MFKKFVVFLGMLALCYVGLITVGLALDMTIFHRGDEPGAVMDLYIQAPWFPALVSAVAAFFLARWVTKSTAEKPAVTLP